MIISYKDWREVRIALTPECTSEYNGLNKDVLRFEEQHNLELRVEPVGNYVDANQYGANFLDAEMKEPFKWGALGLDGKPKQPGLSRAFGSTPREAIERYIKLIQGETLVVNRRDANGLYLPGTEEICVPLWLHYYPLDEA
jgi:hypothetical protein